MTRRKSTVHFTHVLLTAIGDERIAVSVASDRDAWITKAIETLPKWSRAYVEELSMWLIEPAVDKGFMEAINEHADDRWCSTCVNWADDPEKPLCSVWEELADGLAEYGFEICHMETVGKKSSQPRHFNGFDGFKLPPVFTKLMHELLRDAAKPGSATNKFVRETANPFVKARMRKAGGAFGTVMTDQMIDALFDMLFATLRGQAHISPDETMSPQQAAEILGCPWPCTKEQITTAFRAKARETHPDAYPNATETEREELRTKFVKIGLAREVLTKAVA